jgi:hypothetical protein
MVGLIGEWVRDEQVLITNTIQKKWRWIGHTLRREQSSISRQALEWRVEPSRYEKEEGQPWPGEEIWTQN